MPDLEIGRFKQVQSLEEVKKKVEQSENTPLVDTPIPSEQPKQDEARPAVTPLKIDGFKF
jgi:hypothetical protein